MQAHQNIVRHAPVSPHTALDRTACACVTEATCNARLTTPHLKSVRCEHDQQCHRHLELRVFVEHEACERDAELAQQDHNDPAHARQQDKDKDWDASTVTASSTTGDSPEKLLRLEVVVQLLVPLADHVRCIKRAGHDATTAIT